MTKNCKNCGEPVNENFCPNCGQSANTQDINFSFLIHKMLFGIFHVDKGIFYTVIELFKRPGHAIREYIEGKRIKYFNPFAFLFIFATIYAILIHYTSKITTIDVFSTAFVETFEEVNYLGMAAQWIKSHYAYMILLFLPIFALASFLAFRKSKYNYAQHIVLSSYIMGQCFCISILMIPLYFIFTSGSARAKIESLESIITVIFIFWTYFQFFNLVKSKRRIGLTILTFILVFIFFIVIISALVTIIILWDSEKI
jgi:hypothetical protein